MKRFKLWTALLGLFFSGVSSPWALENADGEQLQAVWKHLRPAEKSFFHAQVLTLKAQSSARAQHSPESRKIPSRGPASVNASSNLCNYAGFLSTVPARTGTCQAPWSLKQQDLPPFASDLYTTYRSCGKKNTVRCNPILYGFQSEHRSNRACSQGPRDRGNLNRGCCVSVANENNAGQVTHQCNQTIFGNNSSEAIKNFVKSMESDPMRLAQYLATAATAIKNCPPASRECQALKALVKTSVEELDWQQNSALLCSLPKNFFDLGLDMEMFRETFEALEDERLDRIVDQTFSWQRTRLGILNQVIRNYERNPRTSRSIEYALEKAHPRSQASCYRYVKNALLAGILNGHTRPRDVSPGKTAPTELAKRGFVDITKLNPPFIPLDPNLAPHGSVVIYEDTDTRKPERRRYGHIDIVQTVKNDEGKIIGRNYISDYVNDRPINEFRSTRKPVAIMVYVSEQDREKLRPFLGE